ncbi:MAG TPA: MoxR family ATPase [Candidatus Cloacimonas sp.]|jgi:MoxR-like ATPase|nr:AAA family ATPase [Candidatus Cloacimonas sp.]MDD2249679.1 MoxR family ATPase [Candidatus Cloacimonadota bacterium]MCK9158059.1 AAA family ATPase [Candidatus Cloacimonas sp.]MCK9165486.1 AAA family ATPase [Candidatus Cloacimonas sp.]MDD3733650.1 MoxR family ATPase [Candidatus Cloacimonadota bacterium]
MLIEAIQNKVEQSSVALENVRLEIARVIVGQQEIIDRLLIGILANGHILIEGVPGLAKTLIISSLASVFDASYSRIQFTPDLLPADITGTMIYNPKSGDFSVKKGPVFANFILADEINRAPSKVQSALLEAMQERQVTLGDNTFILPKPFFVMATQNPIEQEGTYPLPEAQVDRFFMKLKIKYPSYDEERIILERMVNEQPIPLKKVLSPADIESMREVMYMVYMEEKLKDYILHLINSTRHPERYPRLNDLKGLIEFGASPRATIYLARAAKANAYISGRAYVIPDDIKAIARDVLRHRIILSYEAEAEEITTEDIINRILDEIEVP